MKVRLSVVVIWLALVPAALRGGQDIKVVNLEKVNSEADEDDPCALSDGISLLYATKAKGTFDVYMSQRATPTSAWPAGKPMPMLASPDFDERTPFYHKPSMMLYYAQNKGPDGEERNFDIVRKLGETGPVPLQGVSTPEDEFGPFVTPGGKEFYFSRMTKKGWILYLADGPTPGPIGNARPVGFPPEYHRATLSSSGLLMYLQGPVGDDEEKTALYRSRRAKVGAPWSKPEPVAGLSSAQGERGDRSPSLSPDGTRLYFASDRPGGKGGLDLYSVLTAQLK
jgi:hypothetical protein